jgi:hypothetical protein
MVLPTYTPVQKKSTKYCKYMGCEKEFYGVPIQKYCDFHTDPHNRKRIRQKPEDIQIKNQLFLHKFQNPTQIEFHCALDGCDKEFYVDIYPKQFVYPKYCEEHRSEFRRFNYDRLKRLRMAS